MLRYYTEPIRSLKTEDYITILRMGIEEDCPEKDITSESVFSPEDKGSGILVSREEGIFCGAGAFFAMKEIFSGRFDFELYKSDGEKLSPKEKIADLRGDLVILLRIERVLLNMIQYLSGIASSTNKIVSQYPNLLILDTRKTLPGYRKLAKFAVYMGGGANHRITLSDMAMIKDNHIALSGSIESCVQKIRSHFPGKKVELEIDGLPQLDEAIRSKPDILLLDNFSIEDTQIAVQKIRAMAPEIRIECSGGITPEKLQALSVFGDIGVSMGYLTHTTRFMDLGLDIEKS